MTDKLIKIVIQDKDNALKIGDCCQDKVIINDKYGHPAAAINIILPFDMSKHTQDSSYKVTIAFGEIIED